MMIMGKGNIWRDDDWEFSVIAEKLMLFFKNVNESTNMINKRNLYLNISQWNKIHI